MTGPRADHTATLLPDGRVLIVGGTGPGTSFLATAELFDPTTGTFTPTGSMSVPRESATATLLMDGRVLITGGHAGRHADIKIYSSAEVFDPATGRFARVGDMSIPRHKHEAVLLKDGGVLVVGGSDERDDAGLYNSAELFDPRTNSFSPAGDLHDPVTRCEIPACSSRMAGLWCVAGLRRPSCSIRGKIASRQSRGHWEPGRSSRRPHSRVPERRS